MLKLTAFRLGYSAGRPVGLSKRRSDARQNLSSWLRAGDLA